MNKTIKDKLMEEFKAAIIAIFGDEADKKYKKYSVSRQDLFRIAQKVDFYLDN